MQIHQIIESFRHVQCPKLVVPWPRSAVFTLNRPARLAYETLLQFLTGVLQVVAGQFEIGFVA
jgi:hypothetical protein